MESIISRTLFELCYAVGQKESVRFLLEGCTDGVRAGGCVAGADVDFFCRAGAGAVVVRAVGDVAGNAVIFLAGLTGFFRRIVVHDRSSFPSKNLERRFVLSYSIVDPIAPFYAIGSRFLHVSHTVKYITATLKT